MKKTISITVFLCGLIMLLGSLSLNLFNNEIYYVKTDELIENYAGTKQARKAMQKRIVKLQKRFDAKSLEYSQLEELYQDSRLNKSEQELDSLKQRLRNKYNEVTKLGSEFEAKMVEEEDILIDGVFEQVNSYITKYGDENGIDLIIGTTDVGNVLYGGNALDITEEVLMGLNKSYNNEN